MKFSIIIPMHNSSKKILDCISSIKNQTYNTFECILIDDGSTDNTIEICEAEINNDSRFNIIKQNNKGVSSARNAGLKNANGDYVIFVDSDDYIHKNLLQEISMIADDSIIQYNFFATSLNKTKKEISNNGAFDIIAGNMAVVWRHAVPRKILDDILFDENYQAGEDYLFLNEVLLENVNVKTLNKCLYYHNFDNPDSIMNNNSLSLLKQQIEVTEKVKTLYKSRGSYEYAYKALKIREKWCKGELLLYALSIFSDSNNKIKK